MRNQQGRRVETRRDAPRPFWQHGARATATSCIAGVAEQYIALAATETHSFSFFALAVGCGAARQKLTEKLSLLFFSIVFFTFYLRAARARVWKMSENCADNKKRRLWPVGGKWQVAGGNDCWLDEAGRNIINSGICKRKVPKKLLNI